MDTIFTEEQMEQIEQMVREGMRNNIPWTKEQMEAHRIKEKLRSECGNEASHLSDEDAFELSKTAAFRVTFSPTDAEIDDMHTRLDQWEELCRSIKAKLDQTKKFDSATEEDEIRLKDLLT